MLLPAASFFFLYHKADMLILSLFLSADVTARIFCKHEELLVPLY
jgi:hypothetical protein